MRTNRTLILVPAGIFVLAIWTASFKAQPLPAASAQGFTNIFDGKKLESWSNPNMRFWFLEDGEITGRSTVEEPATENQYLVWQGGEIGDFELKLKFRISGDGRANSGIQFRSRFSEEGTHATGYQADIALDPQWLGCLYDEGTGRRLLAGRGEKTVIDEYGNRETVKFADRDKLFKILRPADWNVYHIIARGNHIQAIINGQLMSEVIDTERGNSHPTGGLALQLHSGLSTEVKFRDIFLRDFSSSAGNQAEALPEYLEEAGADPATLTPSNGYPKGETYKNWHRSHGDATSSRFSSLDQIDRRNVRDLRLAWTYHSNDGAGDVQCNPIVVDGVMYAPTAGDHLVAINAETGKEIWRFDPAGRETARRGLVYWEGDSQTSPRILFNSGDHLFALNPHTGQPIGEFGREGKVKIGRVTVAGAIYRNILVIPGWDKDVFGYDVRSGKRLWTFHTIPHPGEYGSDTWENLGHGANCWGGMSLDEQRGIAYVTTGSPKPNFLGMGHRGRNLFANCVIALNALNGERLWHFQEIRHDIWDLDIGAPPNLVTTSRKGKRIDAVAAATKLGNVLLLDRLTGRPVFPFRLRRAAASTVPGEMAWPYQPDPQIPEPVSARVFTVDEVTDISPESRKYIRQRLEGAALGWLRPFEEGRANALYGLHGGAVWPGASFDPSAGYLYVTVSKLPWIITLFRVDEPLGVREGPPTAGGEVYRHSCASCHGPKRQGGLAGEAPPLQGLQRRWTDKRVVRVIENGSGLMPAIALSEQQKKDLVEFLFLRDRPDAARPPTTASAPRYSYNGYPRLLDRQGYPGCKPPWGTLVCLNLNSGRILWKTVLGEYDELTARGIENTGTPNMGGATVTAGGLVFAAGTRDNKIRAFDKITGEPLWEHRLPFGGYAPPATYEVNGRQFLVVAATGGGFPGANEIAGPKEKGDAYVAFTLPGNVVSE